MKRRQKISIQPETSNIRGVKYEISVKLGKKHRGSFECLDLLSACFSLSSFLWRQCELNNKTYAEINFCNREWSIHSNEARNYLGDRLGMQQAWIIRYLSPFSSKHYSSSDGKFISSAKHLESVSLSLLSFYFHLVQSS